MAANRSIYCPREENHRDHKKTLLIVGKTDVSVYCRKDGWMKIEFRKNGKLIDFSDSAVTVHSIPKDRHINTEPLPTIAISEIKE